MEGIFFIKQKNMPVYFMPDLLCFRIICKPKHSIIILPFTHAMHSLSLFRILYLYFDCAELKLRSCCVIYIYTHCVHTEINCFPELP